MKKILALLLLFLLTGCFNYNELDELALLSNIGIDYKDDQYKLVLIEVSSHKKEDTTDNDYRYYQSNCKNLKDCFQKIKKTSTQKLYYNTVLNIVINKDIYHNVIPNISEINELKHTLNDSILIFVTEDNVLDLLKTTKDYKYINNLVNDNENTLLKIKRNILEKKTYKIPVLKTQEKDIVKIKSWKVSEKDEK